MVDLVSLDARTGKRTTVDRGPSSDDEVRGVAQEAELGSSWLSEQSREARADLLNRLATVLDDNHQAITETADRETALGVDRLRGELNRAVGQLRFFGRVILDGAYLDVSIEHENTDLPVRAPDLRRWKVPLGPVAVFGSSNFPLAFSAPGGDTASALAAGCSVVVKAHGSHMATTRLVERLFRQVLEESKAPTGVFQVVYGREAGVSLVGCPEIAAVGFTGSVSGGLALAARAASRPTPIPFYGELGSINPVVVLPSAAVARGASIGRDFATSVTMQAGQMCTKPGVLLVPEGPAGDALVAAAAEVLEKFAPAHLLNHATRDSFERGMSDVLGDPRVTQAFSRAGVGTDQVGAILALVDAAELAGAHQSALLEEHFGPFAVVARYQELSEVLSVLDALPPALTGAVHFEEDDDDGRVIAKELTRRSGRIIYNGFPTGVMVGWGMTHGGQFPASTSHFTSVGANAIDRWLRPVTLQDAPSVLLPPELRDDAIMIPRRIDGVLHTESRTR